MMKISPTVMMISELRMSSEPMIGPIVFRTRVSEKPNWSSRSPTSCSMGVPATVGGGGGVGLAVGVGEGDAVGVAVGDGLGVGDSLGLALADPEALADAVAAGVADADGVGAPLPVADGCGVGTPPTTGNSIGANRISRNPLSTARTVASAWPRSTRAAWTASGAGSSRKRTCQTVPPV